ncbi:MAG TPA: branched-chain amino acid ABC transporter permease [Gaiellales bacterium]|nr:branched-chain amino acid ABC transporter permease [Gaiellales bacterium]
MIGTPRLLGLGVVAAYLLPFILGSIALRMAIEILYLGLFAVAFNLILGYAGLLSFGFNATFGVGAYAFALILARLPGVPILAAVLMGAAIGGLVGLAMGALCVRLGGGYFSLMTLALCQLLYAVAIKWRPVTGGEDGIFVRRPDVVLPGIGAIHLGQEGNVYWLALTVVLVCLWLMWRFIGSPAGQAVILVRENPGRAAFLAYNVYATKLVAFAFASAMAAVAGILFALLQGLVSPATLSLMQAGEPLFMAVLGGTGAFLGPLLGTMVYALFQDWLSRTTEHWPVFMGLLFVVLVIFAPDGLVGIVRRLRRAS